MKIKPESSCTSCPANSFEDLKKLGTDTTNFNFVVALAGNPNTGKSTIFNALTGLRQHTGNWPGKTVTRSEGAFQYKKTKYKLIDLPGTYSLLSTSEDEEIARDFILFGKPDVTIIVVDATRLERNLNLALQILEITDKAVLCLNLIDEAKRKHIEIDTRNLSRELGIPVVTTNARSNKGINKLIQTVNNVAEKKIICRPYRIKNIPENIENAVNQLKKKIESEYSKISNSRWIGFRLLEGDLQIINALKTGNFFGHPTKNTEKLIDLANNLRWQIGDDFHDGLTEAIYADATEIVKHSVSTEQQKRSTKLDVKIDRIVTSKIWGFPIMFLLLALVLWTTIQGANYPSELLSELLIDYMHPILKKFSQQVGLPWWLDGFLIDGIYMAVAWVIAVMLPPMAIFFPLFTLLEDFGYLPRVAFNLDYLFKKSGAHGKQALTMSMGFGCNAAGVVATRIIDSPRERLIAIITNNFSLCNGRWPTQILLATIFIGTIVPSYLSGFISMAAVVAIAVLGIFFMFFVSWILANTILKGEISTFNLELPPYRPPVFWRTIYTSLIDRTLVVLWRAIAFAAPAGAVIWSISNIYIGNETVAERLIKSLDGFGFLIGLNGVILLAYIIAIPANEIVIPTILMLTVLVTGTHIGNGAGVMFEPESANATGNLLKTGGWTLLTAINVMLFSLLHNPCSTTIYTIYKETRSLKWTLVASLLPLFLGFIITFLVAQVWRLIF